MEKQLTDRTQGGLQGEEVRIMEWLLISIANLFEGACFEIWAPPIRARDRTYEPVMPVGIQFL